MASDLGWSVIPQSGGTTRQVFYAKYILWTVSFPSAILSLGILSNLPWATILFNVGLAWTWVIAFLVAAYTPSNYKWGFFAFGLLPLAFLAVSTLLHGSVSAGRVGGARVRRDYLVLSGWVNLLWLLYPLAWGLTDGGNSLGGTAGAVWFGVLDVLLVVGVGFAAVGVLAQRWDYERLGIQFTHGGRVPVGEGGVLASGEATGDVVIV
jgi:bacteriorhodopsin